MARKVLLLLLLVVFTGVIFLPLLIESFGSPEFAAFTGQARLSNDLPEAWKNAQRAVVRVEAANSTAGLPTPGMEGSLDGSASVESPCGEIYTVQRGDSLEKIAKTCNRTVAHLLTANPEIRNPNRIYPGQQIQLTSLGGRGGADPLGDSQTIPQAAQATFRPGASFTVEAQGLPPGTPVRVGMGLSNSGYQRLTDAVTCDEGTLALTLVIPERAVPGEDAFILITTTGTPSKQVISETFQIDW